MINVVVLLFVSLLLYLAAADAEEKVTVDPVIGIVLQGLSNYTRIDKIANANTFSYQLINTGAEYLFPSLDIIFDVPFPQEVTFEYNIILQALTDDGWLATRVMIDDEQRYVLRRHVFGSRYPAVNAYTKIWLESGTHRAKLFYRCGLIVQQNTGGWNAAYLKLSYVKLTSNC